ncbi:MAG TPA: AAA family ATPase [Streptosporangiaceae bacterium]|nr:AAA family ATPase [Streptosporangiaceae bacterium]
MREPFVGRAAELAAMNSRYAQAASGRGQVVLITGPPGIGKTTLAGQFLNTLDQPVIRIFGDEDESALAGGLLEQLAVQAAVREAETLTSLLKSGQADSLSAGAALLDLIAALRDDAPLVIAVDDAGWGDELSLKALSFAVRRLRDQAVCCLVACRADDLHRLPAGLLRAAEQEDGVLDLGGLGVADIAELARLSGAAGLSARAAARLRDHTSGVPLRVRELLRDLDPVVLNDPAATLPAPRSLELLVLSRLANCAQATERLVVAAAVLGTDCRVTDAAALAGLDDPLAALQEAAERGLLTQAESVSDRRCRFPHALIRTAVYQYVGAGRRAQLHRLAAGRLDGKAALAHRVAACPTSDPVLAADLETQASADLAAGQPAEAAGHLLAAARVGEGGAARGHRLLTAVSLMLDAGDVAQAQAYAPEVAAMAPSGLRNLVLSRLSMFAGNLPASSRQLADAWIAPGDDHVSAACDLALMLLGNHETAEAARWARRAAATPSSEFRRACSLSVLGACQALSGLPGQAVSQLHDELSRSGEGRTALMLRQGLGAVLMWSDHPGEASEELTAVIAAEGPSGVPLAHWLAALLMRTVADYRRGAWDRSMAGVSRLLDLSEDLEQDWLACRAHSAAVYLAAGRGWWDEAAAHAEAMANLSRPGHPADDLELANATTALAVARDDPRAAVLAAEPVLGHLERLAGLEPTMLGFWPGYACALIRLERLDEALSVLELFEAGARARVRKSMLAAASRVRGRLAAAGGRPGEAVDRFTEGTRHLAGLHLPFEMATAELELGRMLRRAGKRRAAAQRLWSARAGFSALGAAPFTRRCEDELGRERGEEPALTGVPLTPRQLTVARAVAAGKSNKQIADELFISVKTVEFHLSQIFTRLGIDSREEIGPAITWP